MHSLSAAGCCPIFIKSLWIPGNLNINQIWTEPSPPACCVMIFYPLFQFKFPHRPHTDTGVYSSFLVAKATQAFTALSNSASEWVSESHILCPTPWANQNKLKQYTCTVWLFHGWFSFASLQPCYYLKSYYSKWLLSSLFFLLQALHWLEYPPIECSARS